MSRYIELGDEILKQKHGKKWGLKKGNILKIAQGYIDRIDDSILFKNKTPPTDKLGYVYYGLVSGMEIYTDIEGEIVKSTQLPENNHQMYLDLMRTKKMENFIEKAELEINGEQRTVNISDIMKLYKDGEIDRETWKELLKEYKKASHEYVYRGYQSKTY